MKGAFHFGGCDELQRVNSFCFFFLIIVTQFIKEKKQIAYFDAVMLSLPKV